MPMAGGIRSGEVRYPGIGASPRTRRGSIPTSRGSKCRNAGSRGDAAAGPPAVGIAQGRPGYESQMEIIRNADGSLIVPVSPPRQAALDDDPSSVGADDQLTGTVAPTTRVLRPGEGGYDEALAEWDLQQNPDRPPVVSTATGRQEAMAVVHAVASSPDHAVAPALEELEDPEASGEALRHVLVGGDRSVEDFAAEIAEVEGGEPLSAHEAAKIIGEVLAELD